MSLFSVKSSLLLLALHLAACGKDDGPYEVPRPDCSHCTLINSIAAGTYHVDATSDTRQHPFFKIPVTSNTMTFDRESGVVELRYMSAGTSYIERWNVRKKSP